MFKHKYKLKDLEEQILFAQWRIEGMKKVSDPDPYTLNTTTQHLNDLKELKAAYEHMDLNPMQSDSDLTQKVKNLGTQLKQVSDKKRSLAWQMTYIQESLRDRNMKLDALHHIWCNPGCKRGIHRKHPHLELTEEQVKYLNYHVSQINSVYYDSMGKKPRWWHVFYWKWLAKKYEKYYHQVRKQQESTIRELTNNRTTIYEHKMQPVWKYAWVKMWEEIGHAIVRKNDSFVG